MTPRTITVGERNVTLGEFSGRKGARVLRLLEHVGREFPDIQREMQRYTSEYEATHTLDLPRSYARAEYGPQPLMREEPIIENGVALCDQEGRPLVRREAMLDADGRPILGPDPLGHMTDADWEASAQKLRRPRSPSEMEMFLAIFPKVLDVAEDEVAKLLGLVAMPNDEVRQRSSDGTLWDEVARQGDAMLDAPFDHLVELLVAAGETVNDQYRTKVRDRLGERLTNALSLVGLQRLTSRPDGTSSTKSASTTSPTSSTDSPSPTDGTRSSRSTEPAGAASEVS